MAVVFNRSIEKRLTQTPDYKRKDWQNGQIIQAADLNDHENQLDTITKIIQALEKLLSNVELNVNMINHDQAGDGSFVDGVMTLNIPRGEPGPRGLQGLQGDPGRDGTNGRDGAKGERGDPGQDGANGRDGTNGTNGQDGLSFRVANTAVTADANNDFSKLDQGAERAPVVGDTVLDKTNKKLYKVTAVNGGTSKFTAELLVQLS